MAERISEAARARRMRLKKYLAFGGASNGTNSVL
jgi:hypothetical protein